MLSFQSNKLLCRVECCERKWFSALIAISTQHDTHLANSSSSPAITMNACNTREPPKALIIYPNSNSSISRFTLNLFCHQTIRTTHSHEENFSYFKSAYALTRGVCIEAFIDSSSSIPPPPTHIAAHPIVFHKTLCIIIITCREYSISKCNSSNNSLLANVSTLLSTLLLSTTRWENSLRRCCAQQVLGNKKKKTPKLVGSSN